MHRVLAMPPSTKLSLMDQHPSTRMYFLVLQETVIGPLMFMLYVNNIGNNFSPQTSLSSLRMTAFFTRPSIVSQMRSSSNRIYIPWLSGPIPVNEVPSLHFLDSTAHGVFNCKIQCFNLFLTSLVCDANALGSTKVEV